MYHKVITYIILFAFILYLAGCTSMHYLIQEEYNQIEGKKEIWVTLTDGTQQKINEPKILDSKIVGNVEGIGYKEIDLSNIETIGIKEINTGRTIVVGIIGILGGILIISAFSSGESSSGG